MSKNTGRNQNPHFRKVKPKKTIDTKNLYAYTQAFKQLMGL